MVIAWSSLFFTDIIEAAYNENFFVNKRGMGQRGCSQTGTNGEKWPKWNF